MPLQHTIGDDAIPLPHLLSYSLGKGLALVQVEHRRTVSYLRTGHHTGFVQTRKLAD